MTITSSRLIPWATQKSTSRCGLASYFDSSLDGLERFADGYFGRFALAAFAVSAALAP